MLSGTLKGHLQEITESTRSLYPFSNKQGKGEESKERRETRSLWYGDHCSRRFGFTSLHTRDVKEYLCTRMWPCTRAMRIAQTDAPCFKILFQALKVFLRRRAECRGLYSHVWLANEAGLVGRRAKKRSMDANVAKQDTGTARQNS